MRLVAATLVRNAADIIEAFVRHNLTVLDGLAIVDHGSIDGTSEILGALVAERLPIFVARDETPAFDQRQLLNRLVRHVFRTSDADWVFPLDADEFLKVGSRRTLEALTGSVPHGGHLVMPWLTYVPRFDRDDDVLTLLRKARRVAVQHHGFPKVAVGRHFLAADERIGKGSHAIERKDRPKDAEALSDAGLVCKPEALAIAHVPIRSAWQFLLKFATGWLSVLASGKVVGEESFHQREAYAHLRSGEPLTASELTAFAMNYGVYKERWRACDDVALVEDPFLADIALRHARQPVKDPWPLILAVIERLLAERSASAALHSA
jgi:hypothetical protein